MDEYTRLFNDCLSLLRRSVLTIQTDRYVSDVAYRDEVWLKHIMPLSTEIANRSGLASAMVMAILDEVEKLDRERRHLDETA